jgi:putative endonuclease
MSFHVYIAECADGTLYTGFSTDVPKRIARHNAGKGAKYTRHRRPIRLVYTESAPDLGTALSRERQIKKLSRAQKLKLINT